MTNEFNNTENENRYRLDVLNQVMDTNYDYDGDAPPFSQYVIDEDDYLVIGEARTEDDGKAFCDLLNAFHEENQELKTKISFIIDNRIQVYQKHIKKCESMLKLNDDAKQYSDLFNAKVEELEQLKKELLEELEE